MTSVQSTRTPVPSSWRELPWTSWILLDVAGVIALGPLTPTWSSNSNYSFGWYIPLVCIFLLAERWPQRPPREASRPINLGWILAGGGITFFLVRLATEADPEWRPGLWIVLGLYVASLLGWLWVYGGTSWMRYFAFPVCFLILSLPWFFEIEYPLVQGLMRWNTLLVSHSLQGLAIEATPAGNVIRLQNCELGVEEACSGILSLQASLMMGFLLGEIYRLSLRNRVILVGSSIALALLGNYLRTFFLALMAFYSGPDAVPHWHDTAGYAILVLTGLGSWIVAIGLGFGKVSVPQTVEEKNSSFDESYQNKSALRLAIQICLIALLAEVATQAWFGWKELTLARHTPWTVQMPVVDSFHKVNLSEVTLEALNCDVSETGQWLDERGLNWTVFYFRYNPKPYTRIVLGWHNPDNCLPSAGFTKVRDYPDFPTEVNGVRLIVRPKQFVFKGAPVYIFWVVYANRGELPPESDTRIQLLFMTKLRLHASDVWHGNRGVGVETMEAALAGAPDYESAKDAYLKMLQSLVVPIPDAKR